MEMRCQGGLCSKRDAPCLIINRAETFVRFFRQVRRLGGILIGRRQSYRYSVPLHSPLFASTIEATCGESIERGA